MLEGSVLITKKYNTNFIVVIFIIYIFLIKGKILYFGYNKRRITLSEATCELIINIFYYYDIVLCEKKGEYGSYFTYNNY